MSCTSWRGAATTVTVSGTLSLDPVPCSGQWVTMLILVCGTPPIGDLNVYDFFNEYSTPGAGTITLAYADPPDDEKTYLILKHAQCNGSGGYTVSHTGKIIGVSLVPCRWQYKELFQFINDHNNGDNNDQWRQLSPYAGYFPYATSGDPGYPAESLQYDINTRYGACLPGFDSYDGSGTYTFHWVAAHLDDVFGGDGGLCGFLCKTVYTENITNAFLSGSFTCDMHFAGTVGKLYLFGQNGVYYTFSPKYELRGVTVAVANTYASQNVTSGADGITDQITGVYQDPYELLYHQFYLTPRNAFTITPGAGLPSCATLPTLPPADNFLYQGLDPRSGNLSVGRRALEIQPADILRCNPSAISQGSTVAADVLADVLTLAWVNTSGALKVATSRSSWGTTGVSISPSIVLEAANAARPGLVYLPNGTLVVTYQLSGVDTYRTCLKFGGDNLSDWSASASGDVNPLTARGRADEQAFAFQPLGTFASPFGSGNINFVQCRDGLGQAFTSPVTVTTGARCGLCGGVFVGTKYGCLYTRDSDGHIIWRESVDGGATWTAGVDTGLTGQVAALCSSSANVLVGLVWDYNGSTGAKTCKGVRSRDLGATWEIDAAAIATIPPLDMPPTIVALADQLKIVWVIGDAPAMTTSVDHGTSWV